MTYSQIIAYINAYIKANGNREITGAILNQALITYLIDNFPSALYDETRPNKVGNITVYSNEIYVCNEDYTGAWYADKWDAVATKNHSELNQLAYADSGHTGFSPTVHDHNGQEINPDNILLDNGYTDAQAASFDVGTLFYNSDQLDWLLKTSADTYYNLGAEIAPLMKNGDTFTHLNGVPVYVYGGTGKKPVVKLADADAASTSHIIALATQDVVHTGNALGRYCSFGSVGGVKITDVIKSGEDSALWVEGATLYVSSETGKLTVVKPSSPAHAIAVGYITDKSGANVAIFVNIQTGSELSELHDVKLTTPAVGDVLVKDTNYWKNVPKSDYLSNSFDLTDESNNDLFEVALENGELTGGQIDFTILVDDGTDKQSYSGKVMYSAVDKGGVLSSSIVESESTNVKTTGTLTTAWSIVDGANKITIRLVPTSSLTPTSMKIRYTINNGGETVITIL